MKSLLQPCFVFTASLAALSLTSCKEKEKKMSAKNILFICIDDLRTALPAYGENQLITPNIDRLATQSVLFDTHYCSVPFMISAPGYKSDRHSGSLTGSVDIYPTLCELTGFEAPSHTQGTSMVPVLKDPEATTHTAIFSRMNNGISVRTPRYLYTEWAPADSTKPKARMLYDLQVDPKERVNIAALEENKQLVAEMEGLIAAHEAEIARQDSEHDYGEPNPDMSTNPFE